MRTQYERCLDLAVRKTDGKAIFIDYTRYPFIISPQQYFLNKYGISLNFIDMIKLVDPQKILSRVKDRILGAIKGHIPNPRNISDDVEILSHYVSLVVLSTLNDKWLIRRYSVFEAKRIEKFLENEEPETLIVIASKLNLSLEFLGKKSLKVPYSIRRGKLTYITYPFRVNVIDYLKSIRLHVDPSWKLVNQYVSEGYVYLTKQRAVRYLVEIVSSTIESQLKPLKLEELPEEMKKIVEEVRTHVERIREKHAEYALRASIRESYEELRNLGIVEIEAFPPCIKKLYIEATEGKHLSHHARFTLATFLLNIGSDVDFVVNIFSKIPDFNETIARYQTEHLAGLRGSKKRYKPYNCDTMRTLGLCVVKCKVKNPLVQYYREVLRLRRKANET